ncbi:hypothetical protein GH892_02815 [Bacillus thuringiensis]|nr:hypothetical protein [Bacillus thuringiensis]
MKMSHYKSLILSTIHKLMCRNLIRICNSLIITMNKLNPRTIKAFS